MVSDQGSQMEGKSGRSSLRRQRFSRDRNEEEEPAMKDVGEEVTRQECEAKTLSKD